MFHAKQTDLRAPLTAKVAEALHTLVSTHSKASTISVQDSRGKELLFPVKREGGLVSVEGLKLDVTLSAEMQPNGETRVLMSFPEYQNEDGAAPAVRGSFSGRLLWHEFFGIFTLLR